MYFPEKNYFLPNFTFLDGTEVKAPKKGIHFPEGSALAQVQKITKIGNRKAPDPYTHKKPIRNVSIPTDSESPSIIGKILKVALALLCVLAGLYFLL